MSHESAIAAPADQGKPSAGRVDGTIAEAIWRVMVGPLDAMLRSYYGIYEYTDDPDCVFRIALTTANGPLTLADGTAVEFGDPIGALHYWNEHLPRYSAAGPDLRWAVLYRRRLHRSLSALAEHVAKDARWQDVHAFRAYEAFSSRLGSLQHQRVAQRLGFEWVTRTSAVRTWVGSMTSYGLTRVHNPEALQRHGFLRQTHEIWMSRGTLAGLYGARSADRTKKLAGTRGSGQV